MVYKPAHVANAILLKAKEEGIEISPLKLQKLVYYLNGWWLAKTGEPLVGEKFEAWPYGPVLSSLYHEFKSFGAEPIRGFASDVDPDTGDKKTRTVSSRNKDFYKLFDRVWKKYNAFSGIRLSEMTHAVGTPWREARDSGASYLDDNRTERYFQKLAKSHSS